MDRAIASEVNKLRDNPRKYAEGMEFLLDSYDESSVLLYPSGAKIQTVEGPRALQDCLEDLRASPQMLPTLMSSEAISSVCQQHVDDLRENDFCSHLGSDGSTPEDRLARVGEHREQCGENVVFGLMSAKEVLWHMLIDDGAPERGHRANLLNPDFRFLGVAHGEHPSGKTVTSLLLADHFSAKQSHKSDHVRHVAESHLGVPAPDLEHHHMKGQGAHQAWDTLAQEAKPDHLRVPKHLLERTQTMHRPKLYKQKAMKVPKHVMGTLKPKPGIDPAVVRAFVHRVDNNHDDHVKENELQAICHMAEIVVSPETIAHMFDEVIVRRHEARRNVRNLEWKEVYAAIKTYKEWAPTADLHVEMEEDGGSYQLTMEAEALERWCHELYEEFQPQGADLPPPPQFAHAGIVEDPSKSRSAKLSRNRGAAARVEELNAFLAAMLGATLEREQRLQLEDKVRKFLGRGLADEGQLLGSVVCMSLRRLWAYRSRPYRDLWLRIIIATGLNPIVPLPDAIVKLSLGEHVEEAEAAAKDRNVARMSKTPGATQMTVRDPPESVHVRHADSPRGTRVLSRPQSGGSRASHQSHGGTVQTMVGRPDATSKPPSATAKPASAGESPTPPPQWEQKRLQTETVVNACIRPGSGSASPDLTNVYGGSTAPEMAYTFEARRKFGQVIAKQERSSEERRFLSQSGRSRSYGHNHGAGAHSLLAKGGIRGHFHNTAFHDKADALSVLHCPLDGEHVDHTRGEELRPNPKLSKMTASERSGQFSTYFHSTKLGPTDVKHQVVQDQVTDLKKWETFNHEYRTDIPQRHGKFGRRAFDPQVREKPVTNRHGVSEIDNKPVEEFMREQERIHEFLDRKLPQGQSTHFETHQPAAHQPTKYQDMATREKCLTIMDGPNKRQEHGFFQNRHSHPQDMQLYTRPIGSHQLDRKVPMS